MHGEGNDIIYIFLAGHNILHIGLAKGVFLTGLFQRYIKTREHDKPGIVSVGRLDGSSWEFSTDLG
jgi:hypothetical protein